MKYKQMTVKAVDREIEKRLKLLLKKLRNSSKDTNSEINIIGDVIYMDSLTMIKLVCALESEFHFRISDREFIADTAKSMKRLTCFVMKKMKCQK